MEIDDSITVLRKVLGSEMATQLILKEGLSEANYTLENLERVSVDFGVVVNKIPKLTTNVTFMFGFTRRNNGKTLVFRDIPEPSARKIEEAWRIYAINKMNSLRISTDIGI